MKSSGTLHSCRPELLEIAARGLARIHLCAAKVDDGLTVCAKELLQGFCCVPSLAVFDDKLLCTYSRGVCGLALLCLLCCDVILDMTFGLAQRCKILEPIL